MSSSSVCWGALGSAHDALWHADELAGADTPALSTGHAALDEQLPGGGWPVGALIEVLQAAPDAHVWPLLLPALAQAVARHPVARAPVVLIGASHLPFGPALAAAGVPMEALLWVGAEAGPPPTGEPFPRTQQGRAMPSVQAQHLWACEQALRCADVAAVLAWLPQARASELRRLQLAAARHGSLLFVLRPESAAHGTSPARLRLQVAATQAVGQMDVRLLKRRGPPLAAPISLPAHGAHLATLLAAARLRRRERHPGETAQALKAAAGATVLWLDARRSTRSRGSPQEPGDAHALAGPAVAA